MYYRRNARGAQGGVLTPCIPNLSGQLIPISRSATEDPGRKIAPLLVGVCRAAGGSQRVANVEGWRGAVARPPAGQHGARRDGSQARLLRGEISSCGGAGGLRGLRPVNTECVIVFQGWRATSGRVRRAISLRNTPTGNPAHPYQTHGGNVAGIFGRGRRPRRPAPGAGRPAARSGAWGRAGARDARPYQRRGPHAPRPTCVCGGGDAPRRGRRGPPA